MSCQSVTTPMIRLVLTPTPPPCAVFALGRFVWGPMRCPWYLFHRLF
ncbi:unnamed protein product [Staurois parvus]|uniref:Uncharacterized protein n=1 Tax=Staurois parvus TaxID=386267 RepID=A0ABN9G5S2_9NEOB|nr:unnamed protein product [Staurois parvus]